MTQGAGRGRLVLVLGGARSGKSAFAQRLAGEAGGDRVLFVATARVSDAEMAQRIERHRRSRPAAWRTVEVEDGRVGQRLQDGWRDEPVLLLDCVSLLVSALQEAHGGPTGDEPEPAEPVWEAVRRELEALEALVRRRVATAILVSNETGWGLVPPYPSGRMFRDVLGWANQWLAASADEVWLLVAGLPLRLKPSPSWGSMVYSAPGERAEIVGRIAASLGSFVLGRGLGVVLVDTVRAPHVAFIAQGRFLPPRPKGCYPMPPDVAIAVLSPDDAFHDVQARLEAWLAGRTKSVWLVDPDRRRVMVYALPHRPHVFEAADTLFDPSLPGFSVQVAQLFPDE